MPQMSREEFSNLGAEERQTVLKQLEVKKKFSELSAGDRQGVLSFLDANAKNPDVGQFEAGARGLAQGATFGFADEIMAGLEAPAVSFLTDLSVSEAYKFGLKTKRSRDVAAEAQHPGTFGTAEVTGAVGATAIPVAGQVGRGAQVGKGFMRGLAGIAKGTAAGAVTAAGKSEQPIASKEFVKDISTQAVKSGGLQAALNTAGPVGRGIGKLVVKNTGKIAKGASIGAFGFVKTALGTQAVKKAVKEAGEQAPGLKAAIQKSIRVSKKGVEVTSKFGNILFEGLEKQGGAGLLKAHTDLLQDPEYREFLKGVK